MWLWPSSSPLTLDEVIARGPASAIDDLDEYRTVADAFGMSIEKFAELHRQVEQPACMNTPVGLWP
jgi:hypothetical protein